MQNFNEFIDRKNTSAEKLESKRRLFGTDNVIPLWVADMDFQTPAFIIDDLKKRLEHPILGYTQTSDTYYNAIQDWMRQQHQWHINSHWILVSPSVVSSINCAIQSFSNENDSVLVQTPVYGSFFNSIKHNKRRLVDSKLILKKGKYYIDYDDFEKKIIDNEVKLFLLCNPQNPTGRVFTKEELTKIASICTKYNVIIFSDEIHSDIVYKNYKHIPMGLVINENLLITANSAGKTFNISGLNSSYLIIENKKLRLMYLKTMNTMHLHHVNIFGLVSLESAYRKGEAYKKTLILYLEETKNSVITFFKNNFNDIFIIEPEATYLLWIDFNAINLTHNEIKKKLINEVKVGLNDGMFFGKNGEKFMRLNIATPRSVIHYFLDNMLKVFG